MFGIKKKYRINTASDTVNEIFNTAPAIPPSEGMIQLDKFFHSSWVLLKHKRPDLCEVMQEVELIIAGYDPEGETEEPKKKDETERHTL